MGKKKRRIMAKTNEHDAQMFCFANTMRSLAI